MLYFYNYWNYLQLFWDLKKNKTEVAVKLHFLALIRTCSFPSVLLLSHLNMNWQLFWVKSRDIDLSTSWRCHLPSGGEMPDVAPRPWRGSKHPALISARSRKEPDDKMKRHKQVWPWKYLNKRNRNISACFQGTQWTAEPMISGSCRNISIPEVAVTGLCSPPEHPSFEYKTFTPLGLKCGC